MAENIARKAGHIVGFVIAFVGRILNCGVPLCWNGRFHWN